MAAAPPAKPEPVTPGAGLAPATADHAAALAAAEARIAADADAPGPRLQAAARCVYLHRYAEAAAHARRALERVPESLIAHDALAHALFELGEREGAAAHGCAALERRAQSVAGLTPAPLALPSAPPPFDARRPERHAIAFSLFGAASRYCETAILNAYEAKRVYPGWHTRFYVDDSVPAQVLRRLHRARARVIRVPHAQRALPGTMWRFLACDDATLDRVLLRDADSLVGAREARAVDEWLAGPCWFHAMRDHGAHTELLLAGLWGVARAALPPLTADMHAFVSAPHDRHFADQHFLRQFVWPHARRSLLQHDSVFGFLGARAFPPGAPPAPHVGAYESHWTLNHACDAVDGELVWWVYSKSGREFARYASAVRAGHSIAHVPTRLRDAIANGRVQVRVEPGAPQAGARPEGSSR